MVLLLSYFYFPKSARAYRFPQSVKSHYVCSGPISVDPIIIITVTITSMLPLLLFCYCYYYHNYYYSYYHYYYHCYYHSWNLSAINFRSRQHSAITFTITITITIIIIIIIIISSSSSNIIIIQCPREVDFLSGLLFEAVLLPNRPRRAASFRELDLGGYCWLCFHTVTTTTVTTRTNNKFSKCWLILH